MLKFVIKTYTKGTIYKKPHIFILNKGLNSGKPSNEPFTNSFVIIFENKEDFDNIEGILFVKDLLGHTNKESDFDIHFSNPLAT